MKSKDQAGDLGEEEAPCPILDERKAERFRGSAEFLKEKKAEFIIFIFTQTNFPSSFQVIVCSQNTCLVSGIEEGWEFQKNWPVFFSFIQMSKNIVLMPVILFYHGLCSAEHCCGAYHAHPEALGTKRTSKFAFTSTSTAEPEERTLTFLDSGRIQPRTFPFVTASSIIS